MGGTIDFIVYILFSPSNNRFYIGQSSDIEARLKAHNSGKVRSTKAYRPWKLLYIEEYGSRSEAIAREIFLKSFAGWKWLKENKITILDQHS